MLPDLPRDRGLLNNKLTKFLRQALFNCICLLYMKLDVYFEAVNPL